MNHITRVVKKFMRPRDSWFYVKKVRDCFFYRSRSVAPPIRLQIEPVSYCNLTCEFCVLSQMQRKTELMSKEEISKIVKESGAKWVQLSGVGETFLHPDVIEIIKAVKRWGPVLKITTNGTPLSPEICRGVVDEGVDFIDVSIDTTDEALYRQIRGRRLSKVIDNIRYLVDYRNSRGSRLEVAAKHVYNEANIRNLPQDIERLADLPFDDAFFLWIVDMYEGSDLCTIRQEYLEIIKEAMKRARGLRRPDLVRALKILKESYFLFAKGEDNKVCYEPVYAPYVTVNGDLTACCKSSMWILQSPENLREMSMGNVLARPFGEVWNSEKAVNVRRCVLEERSTFGMCGDCEFDQHRLLKMARAISQSVVYR